MIDNYHIVSHRLLTDIGSLYGIVISDRYLNGGDIYLALKSLPDKNFYWLAKLPNLKTGEYVIEAKKIEDITEYSSIPSPPDTININIIIQNRKVLTHRIENYSSRTFKLYYGGARKIAGNKIGKIRSHIYKEAFWEFMFPKTNGTFTILAKLKK